MMNPKKQAQIAGIIVAIGTLIIALGRLLMPDTPEVSRPLPAFGHGQHAELWGKEYRQQAVVPLSQFGLFYWQSGIEYRDIPDSARHAINLAYFDPFWVVYAYGTENSFYGRQRYLFQADSLYWLDENGQRFEPPGMEGEAWELRYTPQNAIRNAQFAARELMNYDGLFLDEWYGDIGEQRLKVLPITEEEWPRVRLEWMTYQDYFIDTLRKWLPEGKFITANTGSWHIKKLRRHKLDAITSEEHWPERRAYFLEECQRYNLELCQAVGWKPWEVEGYEDPAKQPRYSFPRSRMGIVRSWELLIGRVRP